MKAFCIAALFCFLWNEFECCGLSLSRDFMTRKKEKWLQRLHRLRPAARAHVFQSSEHSPCRALSRSQLVLLLTPTSAFINKRVRKKTQRLAGERLGAAKTLSMAETHAILF